MHMPAPQPESKQDRHADLAAEVRQIVQVIAAVTEGDLTRSVPAESHGELAELRAQVNRMIVNLRTTTRKNAEQDWLKGNLAKFTAMLQGQKSLQAVARLLMGELTPLVSASHGVFFAMDTEAQEPILKLVGAYAYRQQDHVAVKFKLGEGLVGQCALERRPLFIDKVPANYVRISSGLGDAAPLSLVLLPVLFEGEVKAVIELGAFQPFSDVHLNFLEQLMDTLGVVLNMITAHMRTEGLLMELKLSHAELEEKAEQLALISTYKSEFLANMSHELRTPLNSLMILARLLSENKDANLTGKQVEFANTIYASGNDLLSLINEILDLSKVESGKMPVDVRRLSFAEIAEFVERSFRQVAQQKGIGFEIQLDSALPSTLVTDGQRLQQVLRNLLSNAFKFTEHGRVELRITPANRPGEAPMLAFAVLDSGIGIPEDKQHLIFEAFQQADGTTSRKYGGTGLGLTISREIARLLGGELRVSSCQGTGSTFTLYLPLRHDGPGSKSGAGTLPPIAEAPRVTIEPQPTIPAVSPLSIEGIAGKRVLVVDDDVRNIFALASVLEGYDLEVLYAESGRDGIRILEARSDIDFVLMDVMMPDMDGYETMRTIRERPAFQSLPILALTANAMPGDREKCLEAGASDYIPKPVDVERLLTLIQAWVGASGAAGKG